MSSYPSFLSRLMSSGAFGAGAPDAASPPRTFGGPASIPQPGLGWGSMMKFAGNLGGAMGRPAPTDMTQSGVNMATDMGRPVGGPVGGPPPTSMRRGGRRMGRVARPGVADLGGNVMPPPPRPGLGGVMKTLGGPPAGNIGMALKRGGVAGWGRNPSLMMTNQFGG
jgi:hypothetical protein